MYKRQLNAIPEDWRNYRIAYAMARALENYAIIGDHDEGTPNYKGDKALRRAIEVLESVREEGQDKAEWNMRMAYGYQFLHGQEEKAIPYAQRWAELDPEDEDAPAVIQECQKEIAKRVEAEAEDESDHTGVFTGFVLLSKAEWDKKQFIRDMKEKWDIAVDEYDASEEKDDDALVFEVGDMLAAVSLNNYPIPGGEAEGNAENNYMWEDAVKVAKEHRAHLMVAVSVSYTHLDVYKRQELDYLFQEWEMEQNPEEMIRESMAPVRQAAIGPMLVGRKLEELCWEPVTMDDPRLIAHPDWLKQFRDFAWSDLDSLTLHQSARIERTEKGFQICIYNRTDYDALLAGLEKQGLSLPTADEWAYLCGGGCRTPVSYTHLDVYKRQRLIISPPS